MKEDNTFVQLKWKFAVARVIQILNIDSNRKFLNSNIEAFKFMGYIST